MKFYIVTPVFNAMPWLPACVRSVMDQAGEGVEVHHHVQDGGSTDGTVAWLGNWAGEQAHTEGYRLTWESAPDDGMYDAINRAWDAMPEDAEVMAHLNGDEQYLEGALKEVAMWMQRKPAADVLLGTYVIVEPNYRYICHRRPVIPRHSSSRLSCVCITNSSFYRAESFRRMAPRFDTSWKVIGDLIFFRELTKQGARFCTIPSVTSCFVCTGENLAWTERADREWQRLLAETPDFWRWVDPLVCRWTNFKRRLADRFLPSPNHYAVYLGNDKNRTGFAIEWPTVIWPARFRNASQNADAPDA